MTAINLLSYGWLNPVLAVIMSTSACLLAIVLSTKARGRPGRGRGRLLVYATVALGVIGVFQSQFLALLGFGVTGAVLRYDLVTLLASLGTAAVAAGAALRMVSFGEPGTTRLCTAASVLGAGMAASHYLAVNAVRGTGFLYYEPVRLVAAAAIGTAAGGAVLWSILSPRGMRSAVLAAFVAGTGGCATHYLAAWAIQDRPGQLVAVSGSAPVTGLAPMMLMAPAVLLGTALTAMLWFFTVGKSTVDDLRAIFEDPENSVEIEPWMIKEVTRRVALGNSEPLADLPDGARPAGAPRGGISPAMYGWLLPARHGHSSGYATALSAPVGAPARDDFPASHISPAALYRSASHREPAPMRGWQGSTSAPPPGVPAPNDGATRLPAVPDRYPPGYTRGRHNSAAAVSPPPTP